MQKGDIVKLEYDLIIKETGKVYGTTNAEVAEKNEIFDARKIYKPTTMIIGAGRMLKAFEEAVEKAEMGAESTVEIPPKDAYGERNPTKVELIPVHELRKQDIYPYPGATVNIRGSTGTIQTVTPGRVRVDFNHPLAGRTLIYKFKVVGKADKPEEKVAGIIEMHYGDPEDFGVRIENENLIITLADRCKNDKDWPNAKSKIIADIREYCGFNSIKLVEEYITKKETEEAKEEEIKSTEIPPA